MNFYVDGHSLSLQDRYDGPSHCAIRGKPPQNLPLSQSTSGARPFPHRRGTETLRICLPTVTHPRGSCRASTNRGSGERMSQNFGDGHHCGPDPRTSTGRENMPAMVSARDCLQGGGDSENASVKGHHQQGNPSARGSPKPSGKVWPIIGQCCESTESFASTRPIIA